MIIKKHKKAISTFIATLLLMVLAVSAGVIIYAYVMGYLGGFTGTSQTMGAMSIDSASLTATAMNVYIRNIGHTAIDFDKAYVNGANATFVAAPDPVLEGGVALVTITQAFTASKTYEFRLIAKDNTQITFNLKAGGTSGSGTPVTKYYKTVTIQASQIPDTTPTLSNFPVLVSFADNVDVGGRSADGHEIYFTSDVAGLVKLDHELETYFVDGSGADIAAWVRIPSLSATVNTPIYMWYGETGLSPQENPTGVWDSNYKGVWHLPNGITLSALDSTSNNNDGTITEAVATAGKIDGAGSFDGANDKIDCGDINSLDGLTALTVSTWVRPTDLTNPYRHFIDKGESTTGWALQTGTSGVVYAFINGFGAPTTSPVLIAGSWTHVALVYDSSQLLNADRLKLYINGSQAPLSLGTVPMSITANAKTLAIGYPTRDPGDLNWKGSIDEVHASNTARSAPWIQTEYNNMNNPSAFITIDPEVSVP